VGCLFLMVLLLLVLPLLQRLLRTRTFITAIIAPSHAKIIPLLLLLLLMHKCILILCPFFGTYHAKNLIISCSQHIILYYTNLCRFFLLFLFCFIQLLTFYFLLLSFFAFASASFLLFHSSFLLSIFCFLLFLVKLLSLF
jgi:hypothetical protein